MSQTTGYNCYLTYDSKKFVAVTQDDLSVAATTKESITKDDAGVKQKAITGHTVTFKVAGIISIGDYTGNDSEDIIDMAIDAAGRTFAVTYVRDDGSTYSGDAILTGYSESSGADPDSDPTYTLDFEISGAFTKNS